MELLAYLRLRGRVGPPRWDDDLAWLAAYASAPHADAVTVDDFRPERGIDRPQVVTPGSS